MIYTGEKQKKQTKKINLCFLGIIVQFIDFTVGSFIEQMSDANSSSFFFFFLLSSGHTQHAIWSHRTLLRRQKQRRRRCIAFILSFLFLFPLLWWRFYSKAIENVRHSHTHPERETNTPFNNTILPPAVTVAIWVLISSPSFACCCCCCCCPTHTHTGSL